MWANDRRTPSAAFLRQARDAIRRWQRRRCNALVGNRAALHGTLLKHVPPHDIDLVAAASAELVDLVVASDPKRLCENRRELDAMIEHSVALLQQPDSAELMADYRVFAAEHSTMVEEMGTAAHRHLLLGSESRTRR